MTDLPKTDEELRDLVNQGLARMDLIARLRPIFQDARRLRALEANRTRKLYTLAEIADALLAEDEPK